MRGHPARTLVGLFLGSALLGCGSRQPITSWYYSSWYEPSGGSSKGGFEAARRACLEEVGITDPTSVSPDSPEETRFIECMNGRDWCTNAWHCDKPGAS